mmetsp:Transcript_49850/g.107257  ORF Transcript_49850/g.107257 Transcript_49850/m.107257 type:complete len:580 (+) Transcript_49850:344-2083(+)
MNPARHHAQQTRQSQDAAMMQLQLQMQMHRTPHKIISREESSAQTVAFQQAAKLADTGGANVSLEELILMERKQQQQHQQLEQYLQWNLLEQEYLMRCQQVATTSRSDNFLEPHPVKQTTDLPLRNQDPSLRSFLPSFLLQDSDHHNEALYMPPPTSATSSLASATSSAAFAPSRTVSSSSSSSLSLEPKKISTSIPFDNMNLPKAQSINFGSGAGEYAPPGLPPLAAAPAAGQWEGGLHPQIVVRTQEDEDMFHDGLRELLYQFDARTAHSANKVPTRKMTTTTTTANANNNNNSYNNSYNNAATSGAPAYLSASCPSAAAEPWKIKPSVPFSSESLDSLKAAQFTQPLPHHMPRSFVPPPNLPSPSERAGGLFRTSRSEDLSPPMLSQPAGLQGPLKLQELKDTEPEAAQKTSSPTGTEPSCRSRGGSSTTIGDAAADSDESTLVACPRKPNKKQSRSSKLKCDIILKVTVEEAREFQLVPRLIGANGRNMKSIVDTYGAKIRIRGRGSGYYETKGPRGMREADIPLQMVYRAEDRANFEAGLEVLTEQLEAMGQRFVRFCEGRSTAPPSSFYEVRR